MVSGEGNHLDATGGRGSNSLAPAKNVEGRSGILKKSFPGTRIYITIGRVLTPGLNFSFRVSEVTGRRRAGRMGFGPPDPRPGYFVGKPDQGPKDFWQKRSILHGDIMPRKCPTCNKTLTRIRRKPWMHRIPGSKHYRCQECDCAYLLIFNYWLLKRQLTHQKTTGSEGPES